MPEKDPINPFGDKLTENIYPRFVPNGFDYQPEFDNEIVGNPGTGPGPYRKQLGKSKKIAGAISDLMVNGASLVEDPMQYAKPMAFGSNEKGMNFDRYYAHPDFKKHGFSPFRDNESYYNNNSSWWSDMRRTMNVGTRFAFSTMGNLAPWNWEQWTAHGNKKDAEEYTKAMSKMMSTRGGFGGWVNNFAANSSYTAGIIMELAAEELVLAGITAATGGLGSPATGTIGGARAIGAATKLGRMFEWSRALATQFRNLNSISKSRQLFQTSKGLLGKTADLINPLQRTTDIIKGVGQTDKISNWAKGTRNFAAFYKDIRDINLVFDESRLEGGMVTNDMIQELTDDFYHKNGRMPNQEEADNIYQHAVDAGGTTTMANVPAIYFSNKIVFGTAFKGWSPKFMTRTAIERGIGSEITGSTKTGFKLVGEQGFKKYITKDYWKRLPGNSASSLMRYTSANFAEGLQELSQEGIASAAKDYYSTVYSDPNLIGLKQVMGSMKKGAVDQISAQGLDVFLTGFLMGGAVQGPQNLIFNQGGKIYNRVTDPKGYAERKKLREDWGNHVVNSLNDAIEKRKDYINWIDQNVVNQKSSGQTLDQAEAFNDKKSFHDAKDDSIFSHIVTLLRSNQYDPFVKSLEDLKMLSPEEQKEEFGENFNEKIDGVISKVKTLKGIYDVIEENYKNPFDPSVFKGDDAAYEDEKQNYQAYEFAKQMALYNNYAFVRSLERMNGIRGDLVTDKTLANISSGDLSILFDTGTKNIHDVPALMLELSNLQKRLTTLKDVDDPEARKEYRETDKKLKILGDHFMLINNFKEILGSRKREEFSTVAKDKLEKKKELRKGREVTYKDKKGNKSDGKVVSSGFDKNGKGYAVILTGGKKKRVSFNSLTLKGKPTSEESDIMKETLDELRKNFQAYLDLISNKGQIPLSQDAIDKAFMKYLDYLELNQDAREYAKIVNILHDPAKFGSLMSGIKDGIRKSKDDKAKLMKEAIENFLKTYDKNDFLNQLFEMDVLISEEDKVKFLEEGIFPTKFLDAATNKPIAETSPKYAEIIAFLNNYKKLETAPAEEGVEEIVTPEVGGVSEEAKPEVVATPKEEKELSTRAVSPTDPISEMPRDLVAQLQSAFDIYNEKLKADPDEIPLSTTDGWQRWVREHQIAFSIIQDYNRMNNLGEISIPEVEEEEETATPEEFVPGKKPEVSNVQTVYQGYDTLEDREFNYYTAEESEAKDYGRNVREVQLDTTGYLKRSPEDSTQYFKEVAEFKEKTGKTFDILLNDEEGLATQREFFIFLRDKGYKGLDMLSGTESRYAVSFAEPVVETKQSTIAPIFHGKIVYATPGSGKTTFVTSNPDIVDADDLIVAEVKKIPGYEKTTNNTVGAKIYELYQKGMGTTMDKIYDRVWKDMTNLAKQGKTILTGTKRYIRKANFVLASASNDALIKQLSAKGTGGANSVKSIRAEEAASDNRIIIDSSLSDILTGVAPLVTTGKENATLEKIEGKFDSIETLKDLQDFEAYFGEVMSDVDLSFTLGLDLETWEKKIADKKSELGESVIFEDLKKGDVLVMKDKSIFRNKGLATIIKKVKSAIHVRPIGQESGAVRIIGKNQIKDQVDFVYTDEVEPQETVVTPEANKNAETNIQTQKELEGSDFENASKDADSKSKKDIDNEFKNSLGCK